MKIGLRNSGTARQLPFADFCKWCVDDGFDAVDIGAVTPKLSKRREMPVLLSHCGSPRHRGPT